MLDSGYNSHCLAGTSAGQRTGFPLSSKRTAEETRLLLDAADALAAFADLEPAGVEVFRQRYPDFFAVFDPDNPPTPYVTDAAFWDYQSDRAQQKNFSRHWQLVQAGVRRAWDTWTSESDVYLVTMFELLHLLTSVFDPNNALFAVGKHPDYVAPVYVNEMPFHQAVQFLNLEHWRAKVCQECGKRFVADHASRKYCSIASEETNCSARVIKRQHLKWGKENNWGREKSRRR